MQGTNVLFGQIAVVFGIVIAGGWLLLRGRRLEGGSADDIVGVSDSVDGA